MTTLTTLKRSTAAAALVVLPLAFAPAAGAQSQAGDQSGTSKQQAQAGKQSGQQTHGEAYTGAANESGVVVEGMEGTQSGPAPDMVPSGDQEGHARSAQQSKSGQQDQTGQQTGQHSQTGQSGQAGSQALSGQQGKAGAGDDAVVAKVGDREIRQSDVLTVIGMLPPQMQTQPSEMLIPIALDQLVMRELILQKAHEAGLANDPTVRKLAKGASKRAKEDAMVQVWLDNQLGQAVSDQKIKQTYDAVKQQLGDQAPPMQALRPQIEQELRQQAFLDLSRDLQEGAEITLYGPDGQPVTQ